MEGTKQGQGKHYVLVHGMCQGAWCWFKLTALLKKAGHRVTALDMAASGINVMTIEEVHTFEQYSKPLLDFMASLSATDKVILVGHSLGGINLALAMEKFPDKISAACFLTAFMPDTTHQSSFVLDKFFASVPEGDLLDTQSWSYGSPEDPSTAMLTGPQFLRTFFSHSPSETIDRGGGEKKKRNQETEERDQRKIIKMKKQNFVLVHGVGHGAWCWFKLSTLLKQAGHRVTALDLGGFGPGLPDQLCKTSFDEYVEPLMSFMRSIDPNHDDDGDDDEKKVILVGHSFGGFAISMAMQKFPEKIQVAVFVTAFMPSCSSPPITVFHEANRRTPKEELLDTTFWFDEEDTTPIAIRFGPECLAKKLYQNCQPEDVELGKMLVKPDRSFQEELAKEGLLTENGYGSVDRVYVTCEEDELLKLGFQKWMIEKSPPNRVISIPKADHMVMLSRPTQLCHSLLQIADSY